jgi:hypothetical protein
MHTSPSPTSGCFACVPTSKRYHRVTVQRSLSAANRLRRVELFIRAGSRSLFVYRRPFRGATSRQCPGMRPGVGDVGHNRRRWMAVGCGLQGYRDPVGIGWRRRRYQMPGARRYSIYDSLHTGARRGYVGVAREERAQSVPPSDVGPGVELGSRKTLFAR